jgi:hypothetical protein
MGTYGSSTNSTEVEGLSVICDRKFVRLSKLDASLAQERFRPASLHLVLVVNLFRPSLHRDCVESSQSRSLGLRSAKTLAT